jgi:hypothetical protein
MIGGIIFARFQMADNARSYIVTAIAVIVGAIIFMSPKEKNTTGANEEPVASSMQVPIPDQEAKFVAVSVAAREAYKAGANEMAKGAARPYRAKGLCNQAQGRAIQNWVGKIETLSSNSDGKGVLSVVIGDKIYLKTWNNSVSDIGDRTLIEPGSPLYQKAVVLQVGQAVSFSGSFIPSQTDCVREGSLTLDGSMTKPEFIFRFSDIAPVQ